MGLKSLLITGSGGMLGYQASIFFKPYYNVFTYDKEKLDITDSYKIHKVFNEIRPDVVLNCAVLKNEYCEENSIKAYNINTLGTYNLAINCKLHNSIFIHISTDYVFEGTKGNSYEEEDEPHPTNKYGWSKYEGERLALQVHDKCYIIRTAWLYGRYGNNFVHKIIKLARENQEIKVVYDQLGSPTSVTELINIIKRLLTANQFGIYHGVCSGYTSRYELAKKILDIMKIDCTVKPIKTLGLKQFCNTSLTNGKICRNLKYEPIHWTEALYSYLKEDIDENNLK